MPKESKTSMELVMLSPTSSAASKFLPACTWPVATAFITWPLGTTMVSTVRLLSISPLEFAIQPYTFMPLERLIRFP